MCNYVSLGKLARSTVLLQLIPEPEIEINFLLRGR